MAVLASERRVSRLEVFRRADELRDVMVDLLQRNFGIRDSYLRMRPKYVHGQAVTFDEWSKRMERLNRAKRQVDELSLAVPNLLRAANSITPVVRLEYEERRLKQTMACEACEEMKKILMILCGEFDLDVNMLRIPIQKLDNEIALIRRWRQKDNRLAAKTGAAST